MQADRLEVNSRQRVAVALAGVVCIVAAAWLFWPLANVESGGRSFDCGNGLGGEDVRGGSAFRTTGCDDLRSDRRTQVLVLAGAGLAIGIGGSILFMDRARDEPKPIT